MEGRFRQREDGQREEQTDRGRECSGGKFRRRLTKGAGDGRFRQREQTEGD